MWLLAVSTATSNVSSDFYRARTAPTCEAHTIQYSGIENERHGVGIDRLRTEGPHVGAVCEVEGLWADRGTGLVGLQDLLGAMEVKFALALLEHVDSRNDSGALD